MRKAYSQSWQKKLVKKAACAVVFVLPVVNAAPLAASDFAPAAGFSSWQGGYGGLDLNITGGGGTIDRGAGSNNLERAEARLLPGFHVGYNFQPFGGSENRGWLLGTEMDFSLASISQRHTDPVLGHFRMRSTFLSSARLRAGYAFDNLLIYGTFGLALSDLKFKTATANGVDLRLGLALGAGVEYKMSDSWSMRLEATAYDFGQEKINFNGTRRNVDSGMAQIRVGFSRKF